MDSIVDWDSDTPQWSAVLNAAASCDTAVDLPGNSLWPLYAPLARLAADQTADQNFVIGQLGQSLDGRIATLTGHSHYINGPAALVHLHRLRALVDAVVVGVGTVAADNPQLNVRRATPGKTKPARVILDPQGRMPADAACLAADGARRVVVRCSDTAPVLGAGVECVTVAAVDGVMPPAAILETLRDLGLRRVLVEGGAQTLSRFLAGRLLDRLHIMTGPIIIGSGPIGIQLPEIARLDEALKPTVHTYVLPGGDILSDCAFR